MSKLKSIVKKILLIFAPAIQKIARFYGVPIYNHFEPFGKNKVILKDSVEKAKLNTPRSVYFNTASGDIIVGKNTVFGEHVMLLTGMHMGVGESNANQMPLHYVPTSGRDIEIGDGCYIGSGAIIIGPCKIGDYAMIGAGAIVTKDVPTRCFIANEPARVKKYLEQN